jgi:hypothetical protein
MQITRKVDSLRSVGLFRAAKTFIGCRLARLIWADWALELVPAPG